MSSEDGIRDWSHVPEYGPRARHPLFGIPVDLPELTNDERHAIASSVWEWKFGGSSFASSTHSALKQAAHEADAAFAALIRQGYAITRVEGGRSGQVTADAAIDRMPEGVGA